MIPYEPKFLDDPKFVNVTSAWEPLRPIIGSIIEDFKIKGRSALELGVERGYSASVLSNYFNLVTGVDKWDWIIDDGVDRSFDVVKEQLKDFKNIKLIQSPFEDYIKLTSKRFDLIHVDIGYDTHAYDTTFPAGEWAVQHSDCVLFHDTLSFPGVTQACEELALKYDFEFYNYSEEIGPAGVVCGLGILIKKP